MMQDNPNAKPGEPGYTTAFGGGIIIRDSDGNEVGRMPYGGDEASAVLGGKTVYKGDDGAFTTDPGFGVSFDSNTGKVTVKIPGGYENDERIKSILDSNIFSNLSANYKANKDVTYQDPYNENEKIDTAKYVEYANNAIKDRVTALDAVSPTKEWLLKRWGSSPEANNVISSLTADDIITMSADGSNGENSALAIPKYVQDMFPKIKELASFDNGYVKASDFQNWYNISNGNLTKEQSLALEKYFANEAMNNIGGMDANELAKTVAFSQYLAKNDPNMSGLDAFWTNTGNVFTALNEAVYGGVATLLDDMVNLTYRFTPLSNIAMLSGGPTYIPVKETLWPDHKIAAPNFTDQIIESEYINQGGLIALEAGHKAGTALWVAAETMLTNVAISAVGSEVASNIAEKGANKVALELVKETDATKAMAESGAKARIGARAAKVGRSANLSRYGTEVYTDIVKNAVDISKRVLSVTGERLQLLDAAQLTKVLSSAAKIAKTAQLANTAMGVMSTFTIAAVVGNSELTNKIIRNTATPAELRTWVKQMALDSAQIELMGNVAKVGTGQLGRAIEGTKAEKALNVARDKASKAMESFTDTIVNPFARFREWAINRRSEAQVMSKAGIKNSTLAAKQAATEAEVVRSFRQWGQTQSTSPSVSAAGVQSLGVVSGDANADLLGMTAQGVTASLGTTVYDPVTETSSVVSPYAAYKAGEVRLRNILTDHTDVQTLETQLISQFANPDIEPVISDYMTTAADADTNLINMEVEAGLLDKATIKTDRKLIKQSKKESYNALFAGHSPEVVRFAVRSQELTIAKNEALAKGFELNEKTPGYGAALERYRKAAKGLNPKIIDQINKVVLPAYRKLEHEVVNYGIDPYHAVFPRDLINGLRRGAKYGTNGSDWIRLAAAKEIADGFYTPNDKMAQNTTVADMRRDKVLEDDQLTWIGNGFNALIREIAVTESQRRLITAARQADDLIVGTLKTGEETQAASNAKEYENDFHTAVRDGIKAFEEQMALTDVVSKLRGGKSAVKAEGATEIKGELPAGTGTKLLERGPIVLAADIEYTRASGIMSMDGATVRESMLDNKVPTTDMIADQDTFNEYYLQSTDAAKKVLADNFSDNIPDSNYTKRNMVDFNKLSEMRKENYANVQEIFDEADKLNAYGKLPKRDRKSLEAGERLRKEAQAFWRENIYDLDFTYEVKPEAPKEKGKRGDNLKYKIDEDQMLESVDRAIDDMIEIVAGDLKSNLYMRGVNSLAGYQNSDSRTVFYILSDVLSKQNKKILAPKLKKIAKKIVDSAIPPKHAVIKGNLDSLYRKAEALMKDRMVTRLADAKTTLESTGENVESDTVKELLKQYDEDIMGYKSNPVYIQTTDVNGRYEWLEVTPALGEIYNKRPIYKPMGTIQETLANMALIKRISLTNLSPRSFAKQAASDPALAFVTTGSLPIPGIYTQTSNAIAAKFGERVAADMAKYDPRRYANVQAVAAREGISEAQAAVKNMNAMAATQLPFATMSKEALSQADANKYGTNGKVSRKTLNKRINEKLREVSDLLGTPNDKREMWNRQLAEIKQRYDMLARGYNYAQAEEFGRHALDNATTNFRQKHTIFNALRSTVPYLTAGISGAKSFWQMFELDPIGVTTRILTGFVVPIIWLMGEIMDDEDLRRQYENLAESEKENHIIIAVNGQLIRIPIGEELGGIVNPIMHTVEMMHGENQYNYWLLMLNDAVGLLPTDFTGFTDPEMWEDIAGNPPSFLEVMDNGVSKFLSATMPPVFQSAYMAASGRDLYTGKRISSNNITIDSNGDAVIEGWSQSEFSKALAGVVGGDARVIEKVTSGLFGTTALHVLDTVTSAVQYVGSGGKSGSLTTAFEKTAADLANPYSVHGYNSLDRRFYNAVTELQSKKEAIEKSDEYRKYNSEISQETDQETRQKKINGRNGLLVNFQKEVEDLINGYKSKGGQLDGIKFSQVASLLTFEDAVRADRTFMHLNTEYSNARALALRTLYDMGVKNPEGTSMLGYIYIDEEGHEQVKVWTPAEMKIIQDSFYQQGDIHQAHIKAIVESDRDNSVKKLLKAEEAAEQPYWDKYNANGKLSNSEWNAIDDLRKAYNSQLVVALRDYIDSYGAEYILNNETVLDYLENKVKVPSEYERVNGRTVSSGSGKLNKQQGFVRSYLKAIFGVK